MSEFIIALHALVFLMHAGESKSSEELSTNLCTNPVRIRKVMAKCKKYGIVTTKAGVNGGYMVADKGENINLRQIYDAVSVPIIDSRWHSGDMDSDCAICSGMAQYVDELFFMMNEECVKMLENIKLCDVEERLGQIKELRL